MHALPGAVADNMPNATLDLEHRHVDPIFYGSVVGQPSTGKSHATRLVMSAVEDKDVRLAIGPEASTLIQAPTLEAIYRRLPDNPNLLGMSR